MDVAGKTALLTGGTAGIGKALAFQLRDAGANVVLTGRNSARLDEMRKAGFEVLSANLSNASGVDNLIAHWGTRELDILVNNAGMGAVQDFRHGSPDPDDADACIYSNLSAPIRLITGFLPLLKAHGSAMIVNVTSGLALTPSAGGSVYSATKAGLRSFTLSLRKQLEGTSITVIEILPPMVSTQMTEGQEGTKISSEECAGSIMGAILKDKEVLYVGQTRLLKWIQRISPGLARWILLQN